ncbi:MAG: hypothetical protein V3W04_15465 [Gammaproteobacteria bacterium]
MFRYFKYLLILIFMLTLAACTDKPGKGIVSTAIDQFVKEESVENIFEITNAHHENGYQLNDFYHVEIAYDRNCLVGVDEAIQKLSGLDALPQPDNLVEGMLSGFLEMIADTGLLRHGIEQKHGAFKKGDVLHETATLKFIKTEKGWRYFEDDINEGDS